MGQDLYAKSRRTPLKVGRVLTRQMLMIEPLSE